MQEGYFRPEKLDDALQWLSEHKACVAAGCTDLFPATKAQKLPGPVLDLTGIDELRGIQQDATHWRFGATTTWTDMVRTDLPEAFNSLKRAALEVGSIQIQNSGTLAGNLCNASPAADGVPCWLTLDAEIELRSTGGTRRLPLHSFIVGPRKTKLSDDEIVSAILVPKSSAAGVSSFLKLGARKYLIISIAMVAARIVEKNGIVADAALSVGSCNAVAIRLTDLEAELEGRPFTPDAIHSISDEMIGSRLQPIDDLRSNAAYRKTAAVEMIRRCVGSLVNSEGVAA
ncbi:MAG: FAD binding domain-containing protein [Stappiaceae bacterium]